MSLSALDSVDDAVEATRRFMVPFDRTRWFRLAVVVFFVGGAGVGVPGVPTPGLGSGVDVPGGTEPSPDPGAAPLAPEVTPELVALVVGLAALLAVIGLLWAVAGAVMEFVFVEALRREAVRLRTPFGRHLWRGVRLFAFRVAVWLLAVATVAVPLLAVGAALGGWPPTGWGGGVALALVALGVPLGLVVLVVAGVVLGFTTVFVVPVMLLEERGVVAAWRRFRPTLVDNWTDYLAYLVVGFLLNVAVGIAVGVATLVVLLALAVPFAVVGVPAVVLLGLGGAGGVVALVLVLAFVVVAFVALLLVKVPFRTFLRYYALFVLGDTNPDFDVIPDARAAVRADGGGGGASGDGSGGREGTDDGNGTDSHGGDGWDVE